jgi:uncharacterized protein YraI
MRVCAMIAAVALAGCGPQMSTTDGDGDSTVNTVDVTAASAVVGGTATVTATELNLRSGPGTTYSIVDTMPHGASVTVLAAQNGWFKVTYQSETGWCSGTYLSADAGGGGSPGGSTAVDDAIARAESGLGFSYHWGAGCWDPASSAHGTCVGSCPNCSHSGSWGADCSGYVAKVWQVPGASALTACAHPYSTVDFKNSHDHWSDVSRADIKRGDAFVHNDNGSGHIFIYDSGDAWGWAQAYEAKGCSYGIVHDTRQVSSIYKGIRRDGY